MNPPVNLVLGIHLHQPVGNFEHVLESSFRHAYEPFMTLFERYEGLSMVWHCTGFLLRWLEEKHPDYVAMLRDLVEQDRLEVLTGGMYEPIFPVIPPDDRREQILRLSGEVGRLFRAAPTGAWLAERVWEPGLVADLAGAGVRYVCLDDYHFFASGLLPEEIDGYFMVEDLDHAVAAFPISEPMRYLIPWAETPRVREEFRRLHEAGRTLAVMLDDGEKFGAWPKTHDWVYTRHWLSDFFTMLQDERHHVRTVTLRKFWETHRPVGRAALPVASYIEMGQWALPAESARRFEEWKSRFEREGVFNQVKPFLQGGIWRNFLVKYPESNYLQKRIVALSRAFERAGRQPAPAYDHLLRAQCNDVFWHGVFGGLYLPHLRHEAWRNLLLAEQGLEEAEGRSSGAISILHEDLDLDRHDEAVIRHPHYTAVVSPGKGGALLELSYRPASFNLLAGLARWKEKYHLTASTARVVRTDGDASTHGEDFGEMVFDTLPRWSCREALFDEVPDPAALRTNHAQPRVSFAEAVFEEEAVCPSGVPLRAAAGGVTLRKRYVPLPGAAELEVVYHFVSDVDGHLGIEWTLGLSGGDDPEKCIYPALRRPEARGLAPDGLWDGVDGVTVEDRRDGFLAEFHFSSPASIRHFAVESVSLSIDTMERTYQGLGLWFFFTVERGENRLSLKLRLTPTP